MHRWVKRVGVGAGACLVAAGAVVWIGGRRQQRLTVSLRQRLAASAGSRASASSTPASLPRPVARYLEWALPRGVDLDMVTLTQEGTLRTDVRSNRWLPFTATHLAAATTPGFLWNARVSIIGPLHVRVLDSLLDGVGAGQVSLLSALPVSTDGSTPEMNSGSLHRYLAEAAWYPTALRASDCLTWTAIDESRALATLRDHGTSVSLEFRFDPSGPITGIYTPGRWGTFGDGYRQLAWEGHFSNYARRHGIAVPTDADVGWYVDGPWQAVWKGHITGFEPRLAR